MLMARSLFVLIDSLEGLRMGIYRDRLDIIADILKVASLRARKTQIMFQANLNHKVLQKYLEEVMSARLISYEVGTHLFLLTDKGQEFLKAYERYSKTNKNVEKWLGDIATKRKVLEALSTGSTI
jgi:predicted transcriptional regulator